MPKGITLTPEQQAARRSEIVDIALRLIAENGFQKTSMREIADLAKMGKSSLYDFFKTKDDLPVSIRFRQILSGRSGAQNPAEKIE